MPCSHIKRIFINSSAASKDKFSDSNLKFRRHHHLMDRLDFEANNKLKIDNNAGDDSFREQEAMSPKCCSQPETEPSYRHHRISEIKQSSQIECLRDCNHLLISHIRKVCESSHAPTNSDIEYLNHLFEADQLHVQDLSDSLAKGKRAIDLRIQETHEGLDSDNRLLKTKPVSNNEENDGEFIVIETPKTSRNHSYTNLNHQQCWLHQQSPNSPGISKELSELEKELERMKERLENLNQERDCKDSSTIDGSDTLYLANRNSKCDREKRHKVEQRNRCRIN